MDGIKINDKVKWALNNNKPIVALESTIISHGMPYDDNYKTALRCEQKVLDNGAIPATIAIVNGVITVGLEKEEIRQIAIEGHKVFKTSSRDIPYVITEKLSGATTVAATMLISSLAGINVFATGGIGGVHRGAEKTFDISADLEELAKTNVAVICAGAKSILDLGLTIEYLETKSVPLIGYNTDYLPAFYTNKSPFKVNYNLKTPEAIALFLKTKWNLGLKGGAVIANPVDDKYSLNFDDIEKVINQALLKMEALKIKGKDTTPFLLKTIAELTKGESLATNIELVLNNCALAAQIAVKMK